MKNYFEFLWLNYWGGIVFLCVNALLAVFFKEPIWMYIVTAVTFLLLLASFISWKKK